MGKIRSVSSSTLVIAAHHAAHTLALTPSTICREGHRQIARSALEVGERVRVQLASLGTTPTAKAIFVLPASLTGTLIALAPNSSFTLREAKGTIITVNASPGTTYPQGTKAASVTELKVGEKLRVQGQATSSGSFAASRVAVVSGR